MRVLPSALAVAMLAACSMAGEAGLHSDGDGPDGGLDAGSGIFDRSTGVAASPEADDAADPDVGASPGSGEVGSCFDETADPAFFTCGEVTMTCPGLRSCCVADSTCCSTVTNGPLPVGAITFDECPDADAASCLEDQGWTVEPFGLPRPAVRGGGLMPMGDDSYDSGLVIGAPVDMTSHVVTLGADIAPPSTCDAGCLDAVGIGFTALPSIGDTSHVQVLAGLIYSGARNAVTLVRGEMAIESWGEVSGIQRWQLRVRPDAVEVVRDGSVLLSTDALGATEARAVVWGRNHNRPADDPLGARLMGLQIETELCDIPTAWPERGELLVRNARSEVWAPDAIRGPTIATSPDGTTLVAFEVDGNLMVSQLTDAGELMVPTPVHESVITRGEGTSYADPELVWDAGTGGFALYYTILRSETASIGRAYGDETGGSWGASGPILEAKEGFVRFEQPTVVRHDYSNQWIMVVRGTDGDGVAQLVPLLSSDGRTWRLVAGDLGAITRPDDGERAGFDADEIAHPSIVVANGAWQLYYAGRSGTRWGVGLIVSDELLHWRRVGEVLAGDGNGFDRLGASAPDAQASGDLVTLVYEGHDGVHASVGRAARYATAMGSRSP